MWGGGGGLVTKTHTGTGLVEKNIYDVSVT